MEKGAIDNAVPFLGAVFAKTGGEKYVVRSPYFSPPSLSIVNGLVTMHVPYYVRKVYFNHNLRVILNLKSIMYHPQVHIDSVFERGTYNVHSPLTGSHYSTDDGGVVYRFAHQSEPQKFRLISA